MKVVLATTLLLFSLLLTTFFLEPAVATAPGVAPAGVGPAPSELDQFCTNKCDVRCSKAGVHDRCIKYCNTCCKECKCVPSGTYGNKHECACYRDKLSSKGTPKCP